MLVDPMNTPKRNALAAAVAASVVLGGPGSAVYAQDQVIEEVVVTGIRSSLKNAMDVKRDATGIVDAISAEDIGKFPDQNVAESLQRITGVSIDRSSGEGQFVTVRGFGPEFNAVLVNGRQIATENAGREFSFDTLAAELISGTQVYKSPTASMQEGGIGATINITTARPFDLNGFKAAGSVKGVYDDLSEDTAPQFSGLISNTFADDTIGVLLSLAHQEREVQNNIVETRYYRPGVDFETDNGNQVSNVFVPQNFDQLVDLQERTRTSGAGVVQFAPNDDLVVTVDAMVSQFEVDSDTHSLGHWFTEDNFIDVQLDQNNTNVFINNNSDGATDFIRRSFKRDVSIQSFGVNVEWNVTDSLVAKVDVSRSTAEDDSGGANPFTVVGYNNSYQWNNQGGGDLPTIDINGGRDALLDTGAGRVHYNELKGFDREDEITELKVDLEWMPDSDTITSVKYGLYFQDRTKDSVELFASTCNIYCGYNVPFPQELMSTFDASGFFSGVPDTWLTYDPDAFFEYISSPEALASAQNVFDTAFAETVATVNRVLGGDITGIEDTNDDGVIDVNDVASDTNGDGNVDASDVPPAPNAVQLFNESGINDPAASANQFEVEEEVLSAYFDITFVGELGDLPWEVNAGVRYSQTTAKLGGFARTLSDLQPITNDPSDLSEVYADEGAAVSASNRYTNILPSLNVRLDLQEDMLLRFAYSETLTRPTMDSLSPAVTITVSRPNNNQAEGGNPDLKPFLSSNWDLSFEWYYADTSYFAAAVFSKEVEDFITNTVATETFDLDSGSFDFAVRRPRNGEVASVDGLELAWTHVWESGFGVQLNATFVDSDADLDFANISETFALEGLGDSQNIVGFYERGPFQARVAFNNREGFLQEIVGTRGGTEPLFTETYGQWDISGSYDISDNLTVFFEGVNITGEETRRHGRFSNQLVSLEDNGSRYALGVRASF